MSERFVVLYHETPPNKSRPNHWDLLLSPPPTHTHHTLESPPDQPRKTDSYPRILIALATLTPPERWAVSVEFEQLPLHRTLYLDFEGDIPEHRGSVRRVREGLIEWLEHTPDRIRFELRDSAVSPPTVLEIAALRPLHSDEQAWPSTPLAEPRYWSITTLQ